MARDITTRAMGALAALSCWGIQAGAQPAASSARLAAARPAVAPAQPSVVWQADGAGVDGTEAGKLYTAFSPDGSVIGVIHPSRAVRLLDARTGALLERVAPESTQRLSYSMAIASTGRVAVGRPGSMGIHEIAAGGPIAVFPCAATSCLPTSLAFSPDGSLLALHDVMPFTGIERDLGSVRVVDLEFDTPTTMRASTGLDSLSFAPADSRPAARGESEHDAFRIWHTADWELPSSMLGNGWTVGSVPSDSTSEPETLVAVYRAGSSVAMREFSTDRLIWAAPLIRPQFAPEADAATRSELDQVEIAPNGRFLVGYEAPATRDPDARAAGAIVVRRTLDGAIVDVYDVPGVQDLAIAPDSTTFVYTAGAEQTRTALVRAPQP